MIYVQGDHSKAGGKDAAIAHAARVAAELGADCVKIPPPTREETLDGITSSLPVPVVVAGGSRSQDTRSFLERMERAMRAGAGGVAVGRNVFQHERPRVVLQAICQIVHGGLSAEAAWEKAALQNPL
jgi:DhnA family fructose-bisphosphate aldolase class Ia